MTRKHVYPATHYRFIFVAHNGPAPWSCFRCGDPVGLEDLVVHHIDENHFNDISSNLAAAHSLCHRLHHGENYKRTYPPVPEAIRLLGTAAGQTPVAQAKRAASLKKFYDEHPGRKRGHKYDGTPARAGVTGYRHTEESKKKMSESAKNRKRKRK